MRFISCSTPCSTEKRGPFKLAHVLAWIRAIRKFYPDVRRRALRQATPLFGRQYYFQCRFIGICGGGYAYTPDFMFGFFVGPNAERAYRWAKGNR